MTLTREMLGTQYAWWFYGKRNVEQAKQEFLELFANDPDDFHEWTEQVIYEQARKDDSPLGYRLINKSEGLNSPSEHCGCTPKQMWLWSVTPWLKVRASVAHTPEFTDSRLNLLLCFGHPNQALCHLLLSSTMREYFGSYQPPPQVAVSL